jgi:HSP20 family protein
LARSFRPGNPSLLPASDRADCFFSGIAGKPVAVPGVKPEDIEVTLTGDLLTIKGEFKSEMREEKANYLRQERRMGRFSRQIGLPAGIDADKVEASFGNGVLTLEMPKQESAKVKTVKVTTKQR